ncbi:hypothetical protein EYF80_046072 [Liparis tanakae]|uniref:Uncharacterized protein n=1 Tax=Liparis tanakae TaxID=230148 RepID=A0A4Z2FR50_9TELE|nr:hypothetical protein EYF80_046072 [Liparis tanakae]
MSSVVRSSVHLLVLTLKAPQLQHHSAALQVVQQTLGGVQRGEVNPVVQQRVDVVPHSRRVEGLAAVIEPEPEGEAKAESSPESRGHLYVSHVSIWTWHKSNLMHLFLAHLVGLRHHGHQLDVVVEDGQQAGVDALSSSQFRQEVVVVIATPVVPAPFRGKANEQVL